MAHAVEPAKHVTVSSASTTVAVSSGLSFVIGSVHYTSDGVRKTMDVAPYIKCGRTYLPVRYVAEALGATVGWDDSTSTATLTKDNTVISLQIGSKVIIVNGVSSNMDVGPEITNGRTCLPNTFRGRGTRSNSGLGP